MWRPARLNNETVRRWNRRNGIEAKRFSAFRHVEKKQQNQSFLGFSICCSWTYMKTPFLQTLTSLNHTCPRQIDVCLLLTRELNDSGALQQPRTSSFKAFWHFVHLLKASTCLQQRNHFIPRLWDGVLCYLSASKETRMFMLLGGHVVMH